MATTIGRRSYKSITALMSVMSVKWKKSGLVKVEGIPAPSGSYEVGCTHLMHQDLQIRLYYPTERDLATAFEYAKYFPHPRYINALLDVIGIPLSSLVSGIVRILCSKFSQKDVLISLVSNIMPELYIISCKTGNKYFSHEK